jgi:flagellar motility protein MotE (MotC chaperone)
VSRIPRILPLVAIALMGVAALRLIGAGPGLFQGAQAWAEGVAEGTAASEGETAAPDTPPPPAACAIPVEELARQAGLSPAELRILQNLSERRGELDLRDVDFETQLPLLISAEAKAQERIDELTALRTEIQGLLGQVSEREQEETNRLVQVYQAMRPRDAAPVFARLSDDVRLPVAAAMRPRALAAIMAEMEPEAARILTQRLASRYGSQNLAARAAADEGAAASSPPQTPAQTPAQTPTRQPAAGGQPTTQPPARTPPQRPRPRPTPPARTPADAPAERAEGAGESGPQSEPPAQPRVSVQ